MTINYDNETKKWFREHIGQQTTVCECKKCGMFYKPSLGHKCPNKNNDLVTAGENNYEF